jgi:filamentous hemagglutinin family protein
MKTCSTLHLATLIPFLVAGAHAEVTLDGTLGRAGALPGPNYQIGADLGQQYGGNLFHSFRDFNLQSHESATFAGPNNVQNVISRVTGGNPSSIDGTLRSTIPNANLYFLNPYGIMFGPNAKLEVQGSFHASTADYLRLSDGGRFEARTSQNSLLTVAPVEAFGFLTDTVASITVEGRGEITQTEWQSNSAGLAVAEGQTLSLIGGPLEIKNGTIFKTPVTDSYSGEWVDVVRSPLLQAAHGRINLASVASPGEIIPRAVGLERIGLQHLGNISLTGYSLIVVSGVGGGSMFILGKNVLIEKSYLWGKTLGAADGGEIDIQADNKVELLQGGQLVGNTEGTGRGSHLHVTAKNAIKASGYLDVRYGNLSGFFARSGIWITLMGDEIGDGGLIHLEAKDILFENGAEASVSTNSGGRGGDIFVKAQDSLTFEGFDTDVDVSSENYPGYRLNTSLAAATYSLSPRAGDAGNIRIEAGRFMMNNPGSDISTTTEGQGQAGNISIKADSITLNNQHPLLAGPRIYSDTFSTGHAGQIAIVAHEMLLTQGSKISSQAHSTGQAGQISISAHDISLLNHGLIATDTSNIGNAGDIQINATGILTIAGTDEYGLKSTLNSSATSTNENIVTGKAGTISLRANTLYLDKGGEINTSTQNASGGNIEITVTNLLNLPQGQITTSVHGGQGDGGNITLDNPQFVVMNHGQIIAQTDAGHGGNIHIVAQHFLKTPDSLVSASSRLGLDGQVLIESPDQTIGDNLVASPTEFIDVSGLLPRLCENMSFEEFINRSTFYVYPIAGSSLSPYDLKPSHAFRSFPTLPTVGQATVSKGRRAVGSQRLAWLTGCHS